MHTRKASFRLPAIIICFASVLWMAACAVVQPEATPTPWANPCTTATTESITSSDPMTREYILQTKKGTAMTENRQSERPSDEHLERVFLKHLNSFIAYPHFSGAGVGILPVRDENGEEIIGIEIRVSELTDPSTLPSEQRIPDCIEGIPVLIRQDDSQYVILGGESNEPSR